MIMVYIRNIRISLNTDLKKKNQISFSIVNLFLGGGGVSWDPQKRLCNLGTTVQPFENCVYNFQCAVSLSTFREMNKKS